jgi:hypothetical protein
MMRYLAITLSFLPALVAAQVPTDSIAIAGTPSKCLQVVNGAYYRLMGAQHGGKASKSINPESIRLEGAKACVAKFAPDKQPAVELIPLATLTSLTGKPDAALRLIGKAVEMSPTPGEKAEALSSAAMIFQDSTVSPRFKEIGDSLVKEMDALGAAVAPRRMQTHQLMGFFHRNYEADALEHAKAMVAAAREIPDEPAPQIAAMKGKDKRPSPVTAAKASAFQTLADKLILAGDLEGGRAVYQEGLKYAASMTPYRRRQIEGVGLVGNAAPVIEASHWLNAPSGDYKRYDPSQGKVSIVEFSAHW